MDATAKESLCLSLYLFIMEELSCCGYFARVLQIYVFIGIIPVVFVWIRLRTVSALDGWTDIGPAAYEFLHDFLIVGKN